MYFSPTNYSIALQTPNVTFNALPTIVKVDPIVSTNASAIVLTSAIVHTKKDRQNKYLGKFEKKAKSKELKEFNIEESSSMRDSFDSTDVSHFINEYCNKRQTSGVSKRVNHKLRDANKELTGDNAINITHIDRTRRLNHFDDVTLPVRIQALLEHLESRTDLEVCTIEEFVTNFIHSEPIKPGTVRLRRKMETYVNELCKVDAIDVPESLKDFICPTLGIVVYPAILARKLRLIFK